MNRRTWWALPILAFVAIVVTLGLSYVLRPLAGEVVAASSAPALAPANAPPPPAEKAPQPPTDAQEQLAPIMRHAPDRAGGPDAFGYLYDDSREPGGPSFSWIAGTDVITAMQGRDDFTTTLLLPFPINFYGGNYSSLVLSANGNLRAFDGGGDDYPPGNRPACFPDASYTRHLGLLAPFWDDLDMRAHGGVYTAVVGSAPNRTFAVEWRDADLYNHPGASLTFEILFDENADNSPTVIRTQYQSLSGLAAGGSEAVVGIQSYDRTTGLAYSCSQDVLEANLAVRFRVPRTVLLYPGNQQGGAAARNTITYTGRLINQTGMTNTFTLSLSGNAWPTTYGPTSVGPIGNATSVPYTVAVSIPSCTAVGSSDTAWLLAVDSTNNYSATVSITTSVTTSGVNFTPATRSQAGSAGSTVTYTSTLTNRSGSANRFLLTVITNTTNFTHSLQPTDTGTLAANATLPVTVSVQIPPNADLGATDVLTLTARQEPPGTCPYTGQAVFTTTLGTWSRRANETYARARHALVAYPNGRVYAIGGEGPGNNRALPIEELNPPANQWVARAMLRQGVSNIGAAVLADGIYIPGGYNGSGAVRMLQVYHPETDSVDVVYSDPLPVARYGAGVAAVGNKLYVIGGSDGISTTRTLYAYDPALPATTRWQRKADMPTARVYLGAAALGGRIYALGGLTGPPVDLATAEVYDPATDTWSSIAAMPTARGGVAAVGVEAGVSCGNSLYALGGGWLTYSSAADRYDPVSNTWTALAPLTTARRSLAAAYSLNGNQLITSGGWNDYYSSVVEALGCGGGPGPSPTPTATGVVPSPTPHPSATPTVALTPLPFSDVHAGDYFYAAVQYLYSRGVVSGYNDNTFRPYATSTRAQLTKMVALGFGWDISTPGPQRFTDVPLDYPLYAYINVAAARGVISGYTCGGPGEPCVPPDNQPYFRPNAPITRGQLCKIIVNAAGWALIIPTTATFSDVPPSQPFFAFIETAYRHGIISGYADGTFTPGNLATRGQLSKILYSALTFPLRP